MFKIFENRDYPSFLYYPLFCIQFSIISLSSMDPKRKILKILDVFRNFRHYPSGSNAVLCFERVKNPLNPFVFGTYEHRTTCFSNFWKSRLSGFLIFIHHFLINFRSIFVHFSMYRGICWDLSKIHEIVSKNCIEIIHIESIRPKKTCFSS